ncbi:hypothetical protein [Streptomonospora nanhaiensis]|uniref:hypothetical protein n=1 Tax=Streptomonospora nanhaiensis TaxID=1323731 RepID=UPI001C38DA95|nr:hypothetical protein [Streptomonospora nanhaiensis]MBV2366939.1 hypothetical protein [Streptomonospora nanhaiensis]
MTEPERASPPESLITLPEAAERLCVKESWLKKECAARRVPFILISRKYRFTEAHIAEITAMFEQRPAQEATPQPRPKAGTKRPLQRARRPLRALKD